MESKAEEGTSGCSHRAPGKGLSEFPTAQSHGNPFKPPHHRTWGLSAGQRADPSQHDCVLHLSISSRRDFLKDGEKIGDLMLA